MSLRSSTWQSTSHSGEKDTALIEPPSATALNFYLAFAISGLPAWESSDLELASYRPRRAGHGGYALVEIGKTPEKQPIVVKRGLKLDRLQFDERPNAFASHFEQLCLELRILTQASLRKHENIIDILGICAEDFYGEPSLSLVLEYAVYGTLEDFLVARHATDHEEIMTCAFQVSNGLNALHNLKICHGDVKLRNVLVCSAKGGWVCKVSDFGHSIVSTFGGSREEARVPQGTPLYNAPEIRDLSFGRQSVFTMADALLTDVFSFGLLIWEILKQGLSFYDRTWTDAQGSELQDMIDVLTRTPHNRLLDHSLNFLRGQALPRDIEGRLTLVFKGALQDSPGDRIDMNNLRKLLQRNHEYDEDLL
ncbi:MAG: hypothetical protein Q9165_004387 [Trypethelium subeluteriae]